MDTVSHTVLDLISNFIFNVNLFILKQCGIDVFVFTTMTLYFVLTESLMVGNSITNSSK